MACDKNAIDSAALTPSAPNPSDMVWFVLADGTVVFRTWATLKNGLIPDEKEIVVTATGGTINNGDSSHVFSDLIGWRIRFYRNGVKQKTINDGASYFTWDSGTGNLSWVGPAAEDEIFQIEPY